MKNACQHLPLALLFACLALMVDVRADQVRLVRSGFFQQDYSVGGGEEGIFSSLSLKSEGFAVSGNNLDSGTEDRPCDVLPCQPGEIINLTFGAYFFSPFHYIAMTGSINGVSCDPFDERCAVEFQPTITGGPFRLPPITSDGSFLITVPMSLSGDLSILKCTVFDTQCDEYRETLASITLQGQGTGTVTLSAFNGSYYFDSFSYTNKPIPEPATMMLLGTGLASIGGVLRRRRHRKGE